MDDREKLIELLDQAIEAEFPWDHNGPVADHLIANGVVIQKEGEWIYIENYPWVEMCRCSVCGYEMDDESLTHYCPKCEAKMKEVK